MRSGELSPTQFRPHAGGIRTISPIQQRLSVDIVDSSTYQPCQRRRMQDANATKKSNFHLLISIDDIRGM
jgi:hypothetical protein